jgi:GcrA cell cycle regulator
MPATVTWTDDRVETLKRFWDLGLSCSQIATEMSGGITRNAVIGKVHRLNLSGRVERVTPEVLERRRERERERNRKSMARRRMVVDRPPRNEPKHVLPYAGSLDIPFVELRPFMCEQINECRFIEADEPGPDYRACGNPTTAAGAPWCAHHRRIAHLPPRTRTFTTSRSSRGYASLNFSSFEAAI